MGASTWLVGSHKSIPATTITVVANSVSDDVTLPAGDYYLDDPTSSLSLCAALESALEQHAQIGSGTTVRICRDRKIRINVADTLGLALPFTAVFSDTTAREALGFTSHLTTSQATQVSDTVPPRLWSGNRPAISDARLGTTGDRAYDTFVGSSGGGRVVSTTNNWVDLNNFEWRSVHVDRLRSTTASQPGEWYYWLDQQIRSFSNFKVYNDLVDDSSSSSALTLSNALGPFVMRHTRGQLRNGYSLETRNVEKLGRVELPVHTCPEYDNI